MLVYFDCPEDAASLEGGLILHRCGIDLQLLRRLRIGRVPKVCSLARDRVARTTRAPARANRMIVPLSRGSSDLARSLCRSDQYPSPDSNRDFCSPFFQPSNFAGSSREVFVSPAVARLTLFLGHPNLFGGSPSPAGGLRPPSGASTRTAAPRPRRSVREPVWSAGLPPPYHGTSIGSSTKNDSA
jgi:hypothetical protein